MCEGVAGVRSDFRAVGGAARPLGRLAAAVGGAVELKRVQSPSGPTSPEVKGRGRVAGL